MRSVLIAVAAGVVIAMGSMASADSTANGLTGACLDNTNSMVTVPFTFNRSANDGLAGLIQWQRQDLNSNASAAATGEAPLNQIPTYFATYCCQIDRDVYLGSSYNQYNLVSLNSNYSSDIVTALTGLYSTFYQSSQQSAANSAGFQMAVWTVLYDTPTALPSNQTANQWYSAALFNTASAFNVPSASSVGGDAGTAITDAAYDLTHYTTSYNGAWAGRLMEMQGVAAQNQIVVTSAPLPAAAWGGLMLLGGLAGGNWIKRKRCSVAG